MHIQTDTLRFMIPKPAYTWPEARFVYESVFLVGRQALQSGYDAILDGTFLKEDYRAEAQERLKRYYAAVTIVCVVCDLEVAKARNLQRNVTVPDASFSRLAASFERPKKAIFVHSDTHTPGSAARYVLGELRVKRRREAADGPAPPGPPEGQVTLASL